jgi:hypothetical protein
MHKKYLDNYELSNRLYYRLSLLRLNKENENITFEDIYNRGCLEEILNYLHLSQYDFFSLIRDGIIKNIYTSYIFEEFQLNHNNLPQSYFYFLIKNGIIEDKYTSNILEEFRIYYYLGHFSDDNFNNSVNEFDITYTQVYMVAILCLSKKISNYTTIKIQSYLPIFLPKRTIEFYERYSTRY